ncbi:2'-5' RNA ligase [Hymenobacter daecheongensis DSM 21074]|uniref:2'-5' RNA ligase n=1 Tax=Hymenobacter daecheongensis DSM 21074 TaxID=1121955 RepID=A0A1M6I745_9BACT|nr:2'-5' RNA ligase family protein [Hymenobacter daecheongensis]SHJ30260.1 2'-5' RNA ligase [Hymenobacter daecheongensis DSM 21074]
MMPPSDPTPPLILTLALDEESAAFFNALRQAHFPPERNYLAAHLTLFHHLPGAELATISAQLRERCRQLAPLPLEVSGLQFLGQGVAYRVESAALEALHRELQALWRPHLTPQDQQKRRPHVTVQNKVAPAVARALHAQLAADFTPFQALGTGLQLWAYRGGPWEWLDAFAFSEIVR